MRGPPCRGAPSPALAHIRVTHLVGRLAQGHGAQHLDSQGGQEARHGGQWADAINKALRVGCRARAWAHRGLATDCMPSANPLSSQLACPHLCIDQHQFFQVFGVVDRVVNSDRAAQAGSHQRCGPAAHHLLQEGSEVSPLLGWAQGLVEEGRSG